MKTLTNVTRFLASLFAMFVLCLALPAQAADAAPSTDVPIATTESFVLVKGTTLWKYAMMQNIPRSEWPQYWKDACALSHIPCTDAAWRKLPVGKVVTVPRTRQAILKEDTERLLQSMRSLRADIAAIDARILKLEQQEAQLKEAQLRQRVDHFNQNLLGFIVFCLVAALIIIFRSSRARRRAESVSVTQKQTILAETPACCTPEDCAACSAQGYAVLPGDLFPSSCVKHDHDCSHHPKDEAGNTPPTPHKP